MKDGGREREKTERDGEEKSGRGYRRKAIDSKHEPWFIIIGFEKVSKIQRGLQLSETGNDPKMALLKKQGPCLVL